ncbi:hypothetical protein D6C89_05889 [Aureobasidium pullulans]|nr:hypothetical protein D6C89_05889 [Aureobasidium pullulans]
MPKRCSPSAQAPSREVLYPNVIHGSPLPVERKPDLATLDAELGMEAQRQQQLHSCDPARYTRAVVLATMDAGLVREFFNRALGIADTPSGTNARGRCLYQACDPALYYSAIEEASFEGVIFPEFFDNIVAHIDYRTIEGPPLRQATHATHSQTVPPFQFVQYPHSQAARPTFSRPSQLTRPHDNFDDHEPSQSPALPSVEALQHTQTFTGPRDTQATYNHPPLALRQSTEPRDEDSRGFKSPGLRLIQPSRPSHPSRSSRPSHASHNSHHSHHSYTPQLSHPPSILRTPYFPRPSRLLQTSQSDAIQTYQALSDQSLSTQQSLSPNYGQSRAPDSPRLRQSHCAQHNDELPFDVAHDDELPFDVAHDDQVHDDDGSRASRHPGFSLGSYHGCGSDFEPEHSLHTVSTARPSGLAPSHNVDSSNRRRSRSPGPASNPALEDRNGGRSLDPGRYRGRSPLTCGEAGDTTDDSSTARDRHHAGEVAQPNQQTLSRIIAAAGQSGTLSGLESHHHTTLSVFEIEKLKNKHVVCVHCWIKNLPCNHKAPCSQCVENNKACAYVACPVEHCTLEIKCPAVHLYTGIKDTHKTGSSMHLIALLSFKSDLLKDYDVSEIQKMHDDTRTMQNIYISLQKDIQQAAKQKKFDDHAARELLQRFKESNSIPDIGYDALCFKAGMLIRFLPQLK